MHVRRLHIDYVTEVLLYIYHYQCLTSSNNYLHIEDKYQFTVCCEQFAVDVRSDVSG